MKTFAILAITAFVAYTVKATPCTDICNGQCALADQACKFPGLFDSLCESQNGICLQACAAACQCADTCSAQCGGGYATCGEESGQVLGVLSCGLNMGICSSTCLPTCNFNLFASIVNSFLPTLEGESS